MIAQYVETPPKEFVHPNAVYSEEYKDDQLSSSFSKL